MRFIRADLNNYIPSRNSYDLIYSDTVLELLETPIEIMAARIANALRPGGVAYTTLTQRNFWNITLYFMLALLSKLPRAPVMTCLMIVVKTRYWVSGLCVDDSNLANKLAYLFIPTITLMTKSRVEDAFRAAGFDILYSRDRLESDINSTSHLEVKMRLVAPSTTD